MHKPSPACGKPAAPEFRALHARSINHHAVEFQIDLQRLRAFIVLMDKWEQGVKRPVLTPNVNFHRGRDPENRRFRMMQRSHALKLILKPHPLGTLAEALDKWDREDMYITLLRDAAGDNPELPDFPNSKRPFLKRPGSGPRKSWMRKRRCANKE